MTDRRAGSVGVSVDLLRVVATLERQLGAIGVNVDLSGTPAIEVGVSTTQAQTASLAVRDFALIRTVGQAQALSVDLVVEAGGGTELTVSTTQPQTVALEQTVGLHGTLTQATQTSLVQQLVISVITTATQAQAVAGAFVQGFQHVVTAVQATAVARQRLVNIMRATTGNRRVKTEVTIAPAVARARSVTARTSPRLVRRVYLTRTVTQGHAASLAGVPVQLQVLAAVQTRSLALERVITLIRGIVQGTAVDMPRTGSLERTLVVPTVLSRQQDVSLTASTLTQAQAATLEVLPFVDVEYYEVELSLEQAQSVALGTSSTGTTAKQFAIRGRDVGFVVAGRSSRFTTSGRRVRFTVEVR